MFAVVDRTNLSIDPANPRFQGARPIHLPFEPITAGAAGTPGNPKNPEAVAGGGGVGEKTKTPHRTLGGRAPRQLAVPGPVRHHGPGVSAATGGAGKNQG